MKVCLIGPRGTGKASLARALSVKYGMVHVSLGALLRKEKDLGSDAWLRVASFVAAGALMHDLWSRMNLCAYVCRSPTKWSSRWWPNACA